MNMRHYIYSIVLSIMMALSVTAQVTESFDSFTLTPNSFYQDVNGTDWKTSPTSPLLFSYGSSGTTWTSGFAYTNMKDTIDGTATNLYGAMTYTPFDGSNYVTVKDSAVLKLENNSSFVNTVSGFFITNTTYGYKTMKNGNASCRKFGDTTGTFTGDTAAQGEYPDWLKVVVFGYRHGAVIADSIQFYLADFRAPGTANDYIIRDWRYVNCTHLGYSDSLQLIMRSSDNGPTGMNTPGYFSIDRLTTVNTINVSELENITGIASYPNPAGKDLFINYTAKTGSELEITVFDIYGKTITKQNQQALAGDNNLHLDTEALQAGVYVIELSTNSSSKKIKFIKQ